MTREEKLANRLLYRHSLMPPYDIQGLVETYADLEFEVFPFSADGVTIGVKSQKPRVFINDNLSPTRKNFTLAHELAHIILPWHIGTIVSDINNYSPRDHFLYREKEAEANRFAAELLMPTNWVNEILSYESSFQEKVEQILEQSKASLEAILIKVMNLCQDNRYLLILEDKYCIRQYVAQVSKYFQFEEAIFDLDKVFSAFNAEYFCIGGREIVTFQIGKVDTQQFDLDDHRTWREILLTMIDETKKDGDDLKKIQLSANSVSGTHFNKNKHKEFKEICASIRLAYADRPLLENLVNHSLFPIYIKKRVSDLLKNQLSKSI